MEINLKVDGMHCDACARRLQKVLEKVAGIEGLEVAVGSVKARGAEPAAVEAAVERAGFSVVRAG